MKMTLNLTFEEGIKVVEAMREVALENGWNDEELSEYDVIEEYSRVVDAALTAMGIEININNNPSPEEDDSDDDDTCQYSLTAKGEFILRYMEAGNSFEKACEVADILFRNNEAEEEDSDPIDEIVYDVNGTPAISESDARLLLNICYKRFASACVGADSGWIKMLTYNEFQDIIDRWGAVVVDRGE